MRILLILACPVLVWGDEICFVPSLAVSEQYNNNVLLATQGFNVRGDYITFLSPGFEMSDKTARLDALLSLALDKLYYAKIEELNATNQHYRGSIRYAVTPLLNVSVDAGYSKDSNPSLVSSSAGPSPVPPIAVSSDRVSSSASVDYRVTELTWLSVSYQYGSTYYANSQYRDKSQDVEAGLVIDLGKYVPRLKGRVNTGYNWYLLPNYRTTNITGTIGFSYDLNEKWSIVANGGLRSTTTEIFLNELVPVAIQTPPAAFAIISERLDQTERSRTGNVTLSYKGESSGVDLSYINDFSMAYAASGRQAPSDRKVFSFTARHQVSRELSALLTAGYTSYTTAHVLTETDVSISPIIRYEIPNMSGERDLAIEASYEHRRIDYPAVGKAYRDLFFIRLSARFPYCSSSQYK